MQKEKQIIPKEFITQKIYFIRRQKVILDFDLAGLYQVSTKVFNQAVKRNIKRFPKDFMFQLTEQEYENLRSQIVTSSLDVENSRSQFVTASEKHGGRRYLPYAFTEHGVAMLSSVLNSTRAIQMNIYIIRAFIEMRELLMMSKDIELEIFLMRTIQKDQGKEIDEIIERLNQLTDQSLKVAGPIGFQP